MTNESKKLFSVTIPITIHVTAYDEEDAQMIATSELRNPKLLLSDIVKPKYRMTIEECKDDEK